ncbi:MAG: calcium/sodium antiporter [Gemmatimonadota bacterium]|nr:calcium/sodium antiporter [Gemmatimonadota bacterium]
MVAGFIYLLGGGDLLVRGAVALARRTRVPPALVALTVVGLGTSLPELMVSVRAAMTGYSGLALGNVVGSNTANVLLVGGVAAIIFPVRTTEPSVRRSGSVMLAVSLLFLGMCLWGSNISRLDGIWLLGLLVVGTAVTARSALRARTAEMPTPIEWMLGVPSELRMIGVFIGIGVVVLPIGADLLVGAATQIAENFGVSDTVVGLSVVAIGTSLPEVATVIMAGLRKRMVMVVGTLLGSNIFNILAIMGAAAVTSPEAIPVSGRSFALDLPVMVGASLVLVSFTWLRKPLRRRTGVVFCVLYVAYMGALYTVG